jgi:hypothetical protein
MFEYRSVKLRALHLPGQDFAPEVECQLLGLHADLSFS